MSEAVAQVRREFGPDAVILHTGRFRQGGVFGLFGKVRFEVLAALDVRERTVPTKARPPGSKHVGHVSRPPYQEASRSMPPSDAFGTLPKARFQPGLPVRQQVETSADLLDTLRARLTKQEIDPALIDTLLAPPLALQDPVVARQTVLERLAADLPCINPLATQGGRSIVFLVGPTGVGKTTTIAKLAANASLLEGRKVSLVTVDTYRIAATDQLQTYADLMGLPLDVCYTPDELRAAIAQRTDVDLILVDTAGRSPRNEAQMNELRLFLDTVPEAQVHLVVSATTKLADLLDTADRFRLANWQYLILTKLDETDRYGVAYNAVRYTGRPLAYLTHGQGVPEDIEVARATRVAELICGGEC